MSFYVDYGIIAGFAILGKCPLIFFDCIATDYDGFPGVVYAMWDYIKFEVCVGNIFVLPCIFL